MKFYLAARYSRHPEMRDHRTMLELYKHTVTSRWINGKHVSEDPDTAAAFAAEDLADIVLADAVVCFNEEPRVPNTSRGGRHVEFGFAYALHKPIYLVGPKENVFHWLIRDNFRYETIPDFFADIASGRIA